MSKTTDITKLNNEGGLTQGLLQTGQLLKPPPPTDMPTKVGGEHAPSNQAQAHFPPKMEPEKNLATNQPVVPSGMAAPSARPTAPISSPPASGRASDPNSAMSLANLKSLSAKYKMGR
jgi:hypothetical protein